MAKFEIFRTDINKVLLTIEKPTDEEAFGAWASAAMISGFLPMRDSATKWLGGSKFECHSSAGKTFIVEVREENSAGVKGIIPFSQNSC